VAGDYEALKNKQTELIRKALDGSVFLSTDLSPASAIDTLTTWVAAAVGPPAVPAHVELAPLDPSYEDLGWLDTAGAQFSRDVSTSEVQSWGSVSPTRTDVTADTTTLSVTAQETKLLTIGMATGADMSAVKAAFQTGEVSIAKPTRAKSRHYRALSLAVDQGDAGEIYLGRFLPRAKVNGYSEQSFGGGDDPITWGVTLVGEEDSDLGYSERWFFGGPGWLALLDDMGFDQAPA
jgi:hypothetical protein